MKRIALAAAISVGVLFLLCVAAHAQTQRDLTDAEKAAFREAVEFMKKYGDPAAAEDLEKALRDNKIRASDDMKPDDAAITETDNTITINSRLLNPGLTDVALLAGVLIHEWFHTLQNRTYGPLRAAWGGFVFDTANSLCVAKEYYELSAYYYAIEAKLRWYSMLNAELQSHGEAWRKAVGEFTELLRQGCQDKEAIKRKAEELKRMAEEEMDKLLLAHLVLSDILLELKDLIKFGYEKGDHLGDKVVDPQTGETFRKRIESVDGEVMGARNALAGLRRLLKGWMEWAESAAPDAPCPDLEEVGSVEIQPVDPVLQETAGDAYQTAETAFAGWASADVFTKYQVLNPLFEAASSYLRDAWTTGHLTADIDFDLELDRMSPFLLTHICLGISVDDNALSNIEDQAGGTPLADVTVALSESDTRGILSAADPAAEFNELVSLQRITVNPSDTGACAPRRGGIAEALDGGDSPDASAAPASAGGGSTSSSPPYAAIAGGIAAAALAVTAGAWYSRRRWLR